MKNDFERDLDLLFSSASDIDEEVDVSADFMPSVWRKIEAARPEPWIAWVRLWSPRLALGSAAAAALLLASAWLRSTESIDPALIETTYVDALTAESMDEHDAAQWTLAGLNGR